MSDMVNHPPHYAGNGIECIDAIESALTPCEFRGYCKGNALKYIWRESRKGHDEDLRKARWYVERLLGEETFEETAFRHDGTVEIMVGWDDRGYPVMASTEDVARKFGCNPGKPGTLAHTAVD